LLAWAERQSSPADIGGTFKEFLADLKARYPKPADIQLKAAAEAGNVREAYTLYRLLSTDSAHPSASSLSRHLLHDEETNRFTFCAEPVRDEGDAEDTAELACVALLSVYTGADTILGGTDAGRRLNDVFEEWKVLRRQKFGAVADGGEQAAEHPRQA
jgi:hypothetical protein